MDLTVTPRADYRSWGRVIWAAHQVARPHSRRQAAAALALGPPLLAVGQGRSYGDVGLNPDGHLIDCRSLDRFIAFDTTTGVLTCEAGVTLAEILRVVCRSEVDGGAWFPPVSPGTRYVSVGGAIANDVHGKNHHRFGAFGEHVLAIELARSDGVIRCSRSENAELFRATIGGLGLTGVILSATIQLRRVPGLALETEEIRYDTLAEFFALAAQSEVDWEYTAAWIDCLAKGPRLGRGVFTRAKHLAGYESAIRSEPSITAPPALPFSMANRLTLPAFNAVYWRKSGFRSHVRDRRNYVPVLYPLDAVGGWNRLYGQRGFYQFQCAVPADQPDAIAALLAATGEAREGSMLTVLKSFSQRPSAGMLSFPMAGFTLALDFPNRGPSTQALLQRLEDIVVEARGRLYPAKDAAMTGRTFREGYAEVDRFRDFIDPSLSSAFARRVGLLPELDR